jgi:hypothetical protein
MRLVIATTNPGKFAEVEAYLKRFPLEIFRYVICRGFRRSLKTVQRLKRML